jgi:hypothetical protein
MFLIRGMPTIMERALCSKIIRVKGLMSHFLFCSSKHIEGENFDGEEGTDYNKWILARSANFNHNISYLKRRMARDRYNIHKLTNIDFMRALVSKPS